MISMQISINTNCSISYQLIIFYKNFGNPSCIDSFVTYYGKGFKCTCIIGTGLSNFHKLVVMVLREKYNYLSGEIIQCKNSEKFKNANFIDV